MERLYDPRCACEAAVSQVTVSPAAAVSALKEDPDDDRMLERAAAAKSDCIVTEDQDLLRIGQFGNARMVTIAEFLTLAPTREKKSRS